MNKIIVLDGNIAVVAADQVVLFPDYGIVNHEGFDEEDAPIGGTRLLSINDSMETDIVVTLPDPWVPSAYTWNGADFSLIPESPAWQAYLSKYRESVPELVSPRQIRQAMSRMGIRTLVETAVAASDQDTKDWYAYATEFLRHSPVVLALAEALSVTSDQLDELWQIAASL